MAATTKCPTCRNDVPFTTVAALRCGRCGWTPAQEKPLRARIPRGARIKGDKSSSRDLNAEFEAALKLEHIGGYEREFKFLPDRLFRFDFAWPHIRLAVEIDGSNWTNGGHNTGTGHWRDCEKGNLAAINGWVLLRFISNDIDSGRAVAQTAEAIKKLGGNTLCNTVTREKPNATAAT